MTIKLVLNEVEVSVNVPPQKRLSSILREDFGIVSIKEDCFSGRCGLCVVFMNGELVPSCLVPAFTCGNSTITTIDGFERSRDYTDIQTGFQETGYVPCSYCRSARILYTQSLLELTLDPDDNAILRHHSGINCWCSDMNLIISGVKQAAALRRRRRSARKK